MTADKDATCPVCGCAVRVVSGDEGTNHYECLCAAQVVLLVGALEAKAAASLCDPCYEDGCMYGCTCRCHERIDAADDLAQAALSSLPEGARKLREEHERRGAALGIFVGALDASEELEADLGESGKSYLVGLTIRRSDAHLARRAALGERK